MTLTNKALDLMIVSAMETGIIQDLIPRKTAELMRARLTEVIGTETDMTVSDSDHEVSCLMCTVRALTEGDPAATWVPDEEGQKISGVVLRMGELATDFGRVPFVDLWTGGTGRVRIKAFGSGLRYAIDGVAPQIGDRLQVWFDGMREYQAKDGRVTPYKAFSANVQRGH